MIFSRNIWIFGLLFSASYGVTTRANGFASIDIIPLQKKTPQCADLAKNLNDTYHSANLDTKGLPRSVNDLLDELRRRVGQEFSEITKAKNTASTVVDRTGPNADAGVKAQRAYTEYLGGAGQSVDQLFDSITSKIQSYPDDARKAFGRLKGKIAASSKPELQAAFGQNRQVPACAEQVKKIDSDLKALKDSTALQIARESPLK